MTILIILICCKLGNTVLISGRFKKTLSVRNIILVVFFYRTNSAENWFTALGAVHWYSANNNKLKLPLERVTEIAILYRRDGTVYAAAVQSQQKH